MKLTDIRIASGKKKKTELLFNPQLPAGAGRSTASEGSINVLCSASHELQCSGHVITHTIKHNEGLGISNNKKGLIL